MIGITLKGLTLRFLLLLETTNCMQPTNNTMHNIVWIMSGIILKARYTMLQKLSKCEVKA